MEGFVAKKLNDFETGKISRRKLIETLTLAATAACATDAASAQGSDPALKAQLINHISYTCPNFREAADWYSKVFNLDQVGPTNRDVALPFGKKGEKPYGVTANDVPLAHLIIRSRDPNAPPPAGGARPRPTPQAVIDHICYTVLDFNRDRAKAQLVAMGVKNVREAGMRSLHMDDPFGYDVQISGLESNALSDGG
jgi:catechol 2,3-dioxygenase-like lactoylglutathione lyase family enzyme